MITSIGIGRKLLITNIYGLYIRRLSKKRILYGVYSNKVIEYTVINQGRSQELEMGGAKLLGEGSGGRLRPKGGCTCTCGTPPGYGLENTSYYKSSVKVYLQM